MKPGRQIVRSILSTLIQNRTMASCDVRIPSLILQGRTIRKVMGGGGGEGDFQLVRFFFSPTASAGIFFAGKTLCTNFFFRQRLLCLSFSNFKRTILQKNCCTLLVLIIIKDHF